LLANCTSLAPGDGAGVLVTHAISRVSIRPSFQGPRRVSSLRAAVSSLGRLACQGRLRLFFPRFAVWSHHRSGCCLAASPAFPSGAGYLVSVTLLVKVFFDFFCPLLRRRTTGVNAASSASRLSCRGARFLVSAAFVVKGFLHYFPRLTELNAPLAWRRFSRYLDCLVEGRGF